MIVDGAFPDSLEAIVLMNHVMAGGNIEFKGKQQGATSWHPRSNISDKFRPLHPANYYRIAGSGEDNE